MSFGLYSLIASAISKPKKPRLSTKLQARRKELSQSTAKSAPTTKPAVTPPNKRSLKRLGFNTGGRIGQLKRRVSLKDILRSINAFTTHWGIILLALVVIVSGILPNQAFSAAIPQPGARSKTVAQLVYSDINNENADYDEVIVTVGDNNDYIFKTGATETIITRNNRSGTIIYEVKAGESVASVARDFGLSPDTLKYANKLNGNALTAGQKLKVPPTDGIYIAVSKNDTLSSIAKKYKVNVADISKFNNLDSSQPIFAGQEILIPGVVAPKAEATSSGRTTISPSGVSQTIVPEGRGQFIWPLQSPTHYISQGFGVHGHTGLDLNRLNGLGIYAAASGVAHVIPGRTGYGNHIDITHGKGWMTRYGHLSAFKIKDGDYVQQGQLIGIMGTTGRSTGVHLHFEIILNGKFLNPLNYLPK